MRAYCYRWFAPARLVSLILALTCFIAPAAAHAQSGRQQRPTLRDEQVAGTDHFLIHYTFKGDNAVSEKDADGSGTPDYVEQVAAALEFSWHREVDEMGWASPPPDEGIGGDSRIDVYLENDMAGGIAGYTESGDGLVGDNPNTPEMESSAAFSYLSIDHAFSDITEQKDGETPIQLMQVTVAHEFNHVLQAGYDSSDPQTWLYEATAVWMEGQVYPDITDRQSYLPDLLDHPERCIAAKKQWYGSWLYLEYLSEKFGPDVVRDIWQRSFDEDGYQAIDDALQAHNTSLIDTSRDFAVANLLRAYQSGRDYPTVHQGGELNGGGTFAPQVLVQSLGETYVRLTGDGAVTVQFAGRESLTARLVAIKDGRADIFDFVDGEVGVNLRQYEDAYVVVHSDDLPETERRCVPGDFALTVERSDGAKSTPSATWESPNFISLSTGGSPSAQSQSSVHQPYRGSAAESNAAQSPEDLKPGFTTIIPSPPEGYYFDYAYLMTKRDLGASAPFYIPDSDQSANYDFLNSADQWISVSETPTHFTELAAWEAAIDYQPSSDPQELDGVPVLVESSAGSKRSTVTATFIDQGLFIVVDGSGSRDDVLLMAESVLKGASGSPADATAPPNAVDVPDAITATPAFLSGPDSREYPDASRLALFGVFAVCGLSICLAGLGLVVMVFVIRPRRQKD